MQNNLALDDELFEMMELDPDLESEMFDYTEIAMASLLETAELYDTIELEQSVLESEWICECLECGFILPMPERLQSILEADDNNGADNNDGEAKAKEKVLKARESGSFRDMTNAIKMWLDEIVANIRRQAIKRKEKYSPWLVEYAKDIRDASAKMVNGVKIAPYTQGDYEGDPAKAAAAIKGAATALKNGEINNFDWAKEIVEPAEVANRAAVLVNHIKNYFRYGVLNTDKIKLITLAGDSLTKEIPYMINYINSYDQIVSKKCGQISSAYNPVELANTLEKFRKEINDKGNNTKTNNDKPADEGNKSDTVQDANTGNKEGAKESYNPFMYIEVEEKMLCETILTSLINYDPALENGRQDGTVKANQPSHANPGKQGATNKPAGPASVTKNVGPDGKFINKETSSNKPNKPKGPASVTKNVGSDGKFVNGGSTSVQDLGEDENKETEGEEKKDGQENTDNNTEDSGPSMTQLTNYLKSIEYFIKLLISSYATACDERFIVYLNILLKVAKYGNVPRPKFDIHGNYKGVSKSNNKNQNNQNTNQNTNSETENNNNNTKTTNDETTDTNNEKPVEKQKESFRTKLNNKVNDAKNTINNARKKNKK